MEIKITQNYPTLEYGDISCVFNVEAKYKSWQRRGGEPQVLAEFISATFVDDNNRDVPMTKDDLRKAGVYEFFKEDAIEEFYEKLRAGEVDDFGYQEPD
jgi:hypothetical protein